MPHVYMFPNPNFGKPGASGVPEDSAHMADPEVAHMPGVEAILKAAAKVIAARAAGRLGTVKALSARSEGPMGSRIVMDKAVLDYYIKLDDTRSDGAAWKIEQDHGILKSATPKGLARLARDADIINESKQPMRKPPKGLVINSDPS